MPEEQNIAKQNYINGRLQALEHIVNIGFKFLCKDKAQSLAIAIASFDIDDSLPTGTPDSFRFGVEEQIADFIQFLER